MATLPGIKKKPDGSVGSITGSSNGTPATGLPILDAGGTGSGGALLLLADRKERLPLADGDELPLLADEGERLPLPADADRGVTTLYDLTKESNGTAGLMGVANGTGPPMLDTGRAEDTWL